MGDLWNRLKAAWAVLTRRGLWTVVIPDPDDVVLVFRHAEGPGGCLVELAANYEQAINDNGYASVQFSLATDLVRFTEWPEFVPTINRMREDYGMAESTPATKQALH